MGNGWRRRECDHKPLPVSSLHRPLLFTREAALVPAHFRNRRNGFTVGRVSDVRWKLPLPVLEPRTYPSKFHISAGDVKKPCANEPKTRRTLGAWARPSQLLLPGFPIAHRLRPSSCDGGPFSATPHIKEEELHHFT